jgi:uncharacterized membrane protein
MSTLIIGLALFLGIHVLPMFPGVRDRAVGTLGEGPYKAVFSLASLGGLVLIVWGMSMAEFVAVYDPPSWGRHVTMLLVLLAFICLVSFHMKGRIRQILRHPFLTAIILWGVGHLLANGDLASILLFGGFIVYSIVDILAVNARKPAPAFAVVPVHDLIAVVVGTVLYGGVLYFHGALFGVPVLT